MYALEPRTSLRISCQIEPAFIGDMRVGVEGDIRDRVTLADEPFARFQMPFHHGERVISARAHHSVENGATRISDIRMHHQVANARDVRFVAVLLEEEPL